MEKKVLIIKEKGNNAKALITLKLKKNKTKKKKWATIAFKLSLEILIWLFNALQLNVDHDFP